jgi:hypothetical protein
MNDAALYALIGAAGVAIVAIVLAVWNRSAASRRDAAHPLSEATPRLHSEPSMAAQPAAPADLRSETVPLGQFDQPAAAGGEPFMQTEARMDTTALTESEALSEAEPLPASAPLADSAPLANAAPNAITETLPPPTLTLVELAPGMLEIVEIRQAVRGDETGEWVLLRNTHLEPVQLLGCRLSDEGDKHQYTFPDCVLAPAAELRVRMWSGDDTPTDLYVGRKLPWWNNTGDTAYLSHANGTLLASLHYDATPEDA